MIGLLDKKWQRLMWSAPVAPKLRGLSVIVTLLQALSSIQHRLVITQANLRTQLGMGRDQLASEL